MERNVGARLQSMFQQLEKLGGKAAKNQSGEDLQQMRYVTCKIFQIIATQEKIHRDSVLKNQAQLDLLLQTLKNASDRAVLVNIINICSELLGKTQVGKKASAFVSVNATNIVFQTLVQEAEDNSPSEEFMFTCHQVLARIGQKDRKFALKARLNRALLVTLTLIKNNLTNFRNLQVLLPVFKLYTNNSVNSSYLGKHNTIPPICKVVLQCNRKHASVLKYGLDILNNLTKSRNNAARTIGGEYVPHILILYNDWHHADTKHRHVSIRKGLLNILKNITNLRSGRRTLVDAGGIRILYESAQDVIECREMENLILLASVIMRKCCPRNKLPVSRFNSVVTFERPESELYPVEGAELASEPNSSQSMLDGGDSDNSSLEDDDDIDSDDERFKNEVDENEDEGGDTTPEAHKRSPEDLAMYNHLFPELFEIEFQEESNSDSIVIPTGSQESGLERGGRRSSEKLATRAGVIYPLNPDSLRKSSSSHTIYRMQTCVSDFNDMSGYSSGRTGTTGGGVDVEYLDSYGRSESTINMKTGANVISLDFPTSNTPSNKLSGSKKAAAQKSKKSKGSKKPGKDKKLKKSVTKDSSDNIASFTNSLCITPIPNIVDPDEEIEQNLVYEDDDDVFDMQHDPLMYQEVARLTKSVYRFEKIAYPDLCGSISPYGFEPLYHRKFGVQRSKVFEDIDRMIHPELIIDRDVYDLDLIKAKAGVNFIPDNSAVSNRDEFRVGSAGRYEPGPETLRFNSQFECGNLRKAICVRDFEYDLILNPDVNINHHHQWFYFEVSNMISGCPYRFNIVNCEKLNSQFNFGMQPILFSVMEAMEGKPFWVRTGTDICYYRNHFTRSATVTGGVKGKTYYTTTFTVTFKHSRDVCYMAYHYPYTFSTLQTHLTLWDQTVDRDAVFFRRQTLCETLAGNPVPVVTITAQPRTDSREDIEEFKSRPYIFLSGRVHPGESNASWVMKGTIDYLLSKRPVSVKLRNMYIFKIVPMLNPDGVINGNHRCSLAGEDLNRRWDNPCPRLHPTIFHCKGLLQYLQMINKAPLVYCDYHGHSRRKNIFIYGCSAAMSWIVNDTNNPGSTGNKMEDNGFRTLPRVLDCIAPQFSLANCSFVVEKTKETTARMVVWRQIGVNRSYTMESTYCGMDREGKFKDQHISTHILEEMGHRFCEGLLRLGRGRGNLYETNLTMPCETSLEQLGAYGNLQGEYLEEDNSDEAADLREARGEKGFSDDVLADDESSSYIESGDEDDVDEL
ncbi:cytosolic carboxypeptidase 1-like [Mya arenaria]|nr:cytosolic carboxypeptidase 1-like [Mya arenaria]